MSIENRVDNHIQKVKLKYGNLANLIFNFIKVRQNYKKVSGEEVKFNHNELSITFNYHAGTINRCNGIPKITYVCVEKLNYEINFWGNKIPGSWVEVFSFEIERDNDKWKIKDFSVKKCGADEANRVYIAICKYLIEQTNNILSKAKFFLDNEDCNIESNNLVNKLVGDYKTAFDELMKL